MPSSVATNVITDPSKYLFCDRKIDFNFDFTAVESIRRLRSEVFTRSTKSIKSNSKAYQTLQRYIPPTILSGSFLLATVATSTIVCSDLSGQQPFADVTYWFVQVSGRNVARPLDTEITWRCVAQGLDDQSCETEAQRS
jgi:hypothetical protein